MVEKKKEARTPGRHAATQAPQFHTLACISDLVRGSLVVHAQNGHVESRRTASGRLTVEVEGGDNVEGGIPVHLLAPSSWARF